MKLIDYQDPRPIYEQIAEGYKKMILKGALQDGDPMPSVRSLASTLSTNPNTVQKAYAQLEREGFLTPAKGKGNFVHAGNELMEARKNEIAGRIAKEVQEASDLGISREELFASVDGILKEGAK